MAEQLVDVRYRGLAISEASALRDVGPSTAFLATQRPMPVGTELQLTTPDGVSFTARVVHVDEFVDGVDKPGMRIAVRDLPDDVAAWWREAATASDPTPLSQLPEPAAPEAVPEPTESGGARTQIMQAVDMDQIEAMAAEELARREREAAEAGVDDGVGDTDNGSNGKRNRKKKRRR